MHFTVDHQAWLPPTALNDGRLLEGVSGAIEKWGVAWMGSRRALNLSVNESRSDFGVFEPSYSLEAGPAISIEASDRDALAEKLLGMSFDGLSANTADKNLLHGLVEEALSDVLTQVTGCSGEVQSGIAQESWELYFSVSFDGVVLFQIALPLAFAVDWRKKLAPSVEAETIEFGDIRAAIANKVVKLEAEVGSLSFDMNKMSKLRVGDVMELDRAVDEGFPLRANGSTCAGIQARFIVTQPKKRARRQPNLILEHSK